MAKASVILIIFCEYAVVTAKYVWQGYATRKDIPPTSKVPDLETHAMCPTGDATKNSVADNRLTN